MLVATSAQSIAHCSSADGGRPPLAPQRRVSDRQASAATVRMPLSLTDADKYRWIRANRANLEIVAALQHAHRDIDFDHLIEAAMRMSVASPSYFGELDELPLP
jgi:hypothetical protein